MKICFIAPVVNKRGGTERYLAQLIETFSQDNDITVYSSSVKDLDTDNFRHVKVPVIRFPGILYFLSFFIMNNLIMIFFRKRYDIVHSTGPDSLFADITTFQFCQNARWELLEKKIIKFSKSGLKALLRKWHYYLYTFLVTRIEKFTCKRPRLKAIIAVGSKVKEELINYYSLPPEKISVIYNGYSPDEFNVKDRDTYRSATRSSLSIKDNHSAFLFTGGDWERKGLEIALRAFSKVEGRNRFVVVGHGDTASYQKICDELAISERVNFIPPTREIKKYYHAADIFLFPTLYEPFGMAPLEAMACGLPCIVSRLSGCAELISHMKDGLLIEEPSNIEELSGHMQKLLEDPTLKDDISVAAIAKARSASWDKIMDKTKKVYEQVKTGWIEKSGT